MPLISMIGESMAKVATAYLVAATLAGANATAERSKNVARAETALEYNQMVDYRNSLSPEERMAQQPQLDAWHYKIARRRGQIEHK